MKRLLVINPNTSERVSALLQQHVQAAAGSHVAVRTVTARFGAPYIADEASYAVAAHAALDAWAAALASDEPKPDTVLIGCFGDPGLMALRESSPVSVTGLAEAAFIEAARHGRYAIVTGGERWGPMLQRLAQALGQAQQLAGIHTVAPTGAQLAADPAAAHRLLAQACRDAAHQLGVQAVILGGAGLAGMAAVIQGNVPVPVIDSVTAGTHWALRTTPLPPARRTAGFDIAWQGLSPEMLALGTLAPPGANAAPAVTSRGGLMGRGACRWRTAPITTEAAAATQGAPVAVTCGMVRSSQHLHPARTPAAVRPAATVLLLRDGDNGVEVLMTRRSMTASFAPGAYVFPGGGIDAADAQTHGQSTRRPTQSDLHLTQAIAAIRESFEELGVLLARRADGSHLGTADIASLDRKTPFAAQCAAHGLTLSGAEVFVLAHWITDRDLPRRFDVPFLVARMPAGQQPVADEAEQFEPVWVRPADALARHAAGDFFIIFPTIRTLERLQAYATVDAVLDACAINDEPLFTSCPRAGFMNGHESRHMEHEQPFGELALVCPDGQIEHELAWQTERPVPLLKNVQRLTAPNPGFMTGPGTNSYLVGDPATGHIAIDPGPDDPGHIERLWRAAGGDIRAIVCTHSHPDHSPGAARLQGLCASRPPILGLPSAPTSRENSRFTPERALADGERLVLQGADGTVHTLQVVHTPGHAANHLCLLLEEDGLLFSGDHILNGSTTVIDPPDGHMGDYLDSLDKLDRLCAAHGVDFILPAHGYVLGDLQRTADNPSAPEHGGARAAIAHLKAHRLAREAKVARAMQARPDGTVDDWVQLAYDDVPERLWPVAKRSMLAHVQRIQSLGGFNA